MRTALALFRYFPFGGMQRDMLATANACVAAGHEVTIYCHTWQGERPANLTLNVLAVRGSSNHTRARRFAARLHGELQRRPADAVVGFDKMPGLDLYFAADPCFVTRTADRPWPYRLTPRYRAFRALEAAVFGEHSNTRILLLDAREQANYRRVYNTATERFVPLPPGIAPDRRRDDNADEHRTSMRSELGFAANDIVLLMLGANLELKGIDRMLRAIACLPAATQQRTHLLAVGQATNEPTQQLAKSLGIAERTHLLRGRDDVPRLLQGADVLVHPARRDTTGTVLLEALVAGLPVLCTAACGYAQHISQANAGLVLSEPFAQADLDRALADMLAGDRATYSSAALRYAEANDLHGMHELIVQEISTAHSLNGEADADRSPPH